MLAKMKDVINVAKLGNCGMKTTIALLLCNFKDQKGNHFHLDQVVNVLHAYI